jgi:electron transfer flavoprotein alpha subunit
MNRDVLVVVEHLQGQVAEITYVMLAAARALAEGSGGDVLAVLLGHDARGLAADLSADRVLYVDHPSVAEFTPDAYTRVLAGVIAEQSPRAVLFGDTSIGAEVAAGLSARLDLPLVSSCKVVRADGAALAFVSQIYGGKIMAEGPLPEPTVLVLMVPGGYKADQGRATTPPDVVAVVAPDLGGLGVTLKRYIEPEAADVDISKAPILVAVGRGIQQQDNIELAEELATALGGTVCASRPIVDQGWLPAARLVGKSGRIVKPKLYLALGISGAPEHVEGITGSELIVAVNTDPAAPIFDVAHYGTEADMFDLLPVLTDLVQRARGA